MTIHYFALVSAQATETENNQVIGWSAVQGDSTTSVPPCPTDDGVRAVLLPDMTGEVWAPLTRGQRGLVSLENGKIVPYVQPPVPLKEKARAAMAGVMYATQTRGWGVFVPMPDAVTAYGKALAAIVNGTDTTTTDLPAPPAELN